ncbi:uncharacterized protein LOC127289056 [Leptopilina boulardi]|uniref:uncharacterized protein LOC127289056 n=1 Tax=Leptopilina boulardi TaxID=63433 RepID=UPI0021F5BB66|nr:uncharacterized protein LOC127289056 [Leptopilina boulardi]
MLQAARHVIRKVSQNGVRYSSHGKIDPRRPHMNELPIPQGCWQQNYNEKQKTYNMQLVAGLAVLSATIGYIVQSDQFFFNAFPPKLPKE